jgi:hypothetical protein
MVNIPKNALSKEKLTQSRVNVSMKDPEHLKKWLQRSGRDWIVFRADNLVDALSFPEEVELFMQIVSAYRNYRQTLESGRFIRQEAVVSGQDINVPIMKSENLEMEELDRLIRSLVTQITEKDPTWTLDGTPL